MEKEATRAKEEKRVRVRFGRHIFCQKCGRDDEIHIRWLDQFTYRYECSRCKVVVKEKNRVLIKDAVIGSIIARKDMPRLGVQILGVSKDWNNMWKVATLNKELAKRGWLHKKGLVSQDDTRWFIVSEKK